MSAHLSGTSRDSTDLRAVGDVTHTFIFNAFKSSTKSHNQNTDIWLLQGRVFTESHDLLIAHSEFTHIQEWRGGLESLPSFERSLNIHMLYILSYMFMFSFFTPQEYFMPYFIF